SISAFTPRQILIPASRRCSLLPRGQARKSDLSSLHYGPLPPVSLFQTLLSRREGKKLAFFQKLPVPNHFCASIYSASFASNAKRETTGRASPIVPGSGGVPARYLAACSVRPVAAWAANRQWRHSGPNWISKPLPTDSMEQSTNCARSSNPASNAPRPQSFFASNAIY